jgi:hypothetical protein
MGPAPSAAVPGSGGETTAGWRPWVWLAVYVVLVYAGAPFTPALAAALDASAWKQGVVDVLVLAAAAGLVYLVRGFDWRRRAAVRVIPWLVIVGLYAGAWRWLCQQPIEAAHLAQYGLMGALARFALQGTLSPPLAYGGSVLFTAAASWGNELVQSMIPTRVYDVRDVVLDVIAAMLGLTIAWQLERSPLVSVVGGPGEREA